MGLNMGRVGTMRRMRDGCMIPVCEDWSPQVVKWLTGEWTSTLLLAPFSVGASGAAQRVTSIDFSVPLLYSISARFLRTLPYLPSPVPFF